MDGRISTEIDGKTYSASYAVFVEGEPLITVIAHGDLEGRTKTTQLGGSGPEGLARIMLHNLVADKATGFGGA